jgi:hypothetical protein
MLYLSHRMGFSRNYNGADRLQRVEGDHTDPKRTSGSTNPPLPGQEGNAENRERTLVERTAYCSENAPQGRVFVHRVKATAIAAGVPSGPDPTNVRGVICLPPLTTFGLCSAPYCIYCMHTTPQTGSGSGPRLTPIRHRAHDRPTLHVHECFAAQKTVQLVACARACVRAWDKDPIAQSSVMRCRPHPR